MHGTFAAFTVLRTVLAADRATGELIHVRTIGPDRPLAAVHVPPLSPYAFILYDNPDLRPFAPHYYALNSPVVVVHRQPMPGGMFAFRDTLRMTALIAAPVLDANGGGITMFAGDADETQEYNLVAIPGGGLPAAVGRQIALIERASAASPRDILGFLRDTRADERAAIASLLMQTLTPPDVDAVVADLLGEAVKLGELAALFPGDPWAETGLPALRRVFQSRRVQAAASTVPDRPAEASDIAQSGVAVVGPDLDRLAVDGAGGQYVSLPHRCTVAARRAVTPTKDLCIVACARDDGLYLLEWLAYHRSIGVDQIFIYTNDNSDGSDKLLHALAAASEIRLTENVLRLGGVSPVYKAYGHALSMNPEVLDYRWCAIIDPDELIGFDLDLFGSLKDYISWQESQPVDAIALNWLVFGSSGALRWHNEPMLSRFLDRYCDTTINTIFRPQHFHHANGHFPITHRPSDVVCRDAIGQPVRTHQPETPIKRDSPAWIAHYFCRSFEEFVWKFARGRGDEPLRATLPMVNVPDQFMEGFVEQHRRSSTRDERMLVFARDMKVQSERLRILPGIQEALDAVHAHYQGRSAALEPALRQLREGASPTQAAFYDLLLDPDRVRSPEAAVQNVARSHEE